MPSFFCIYDGKEYPDTERSEEHIVPFAIGGPRAFTTHDVSQSANSRMGAHVDAPLVDDFRVVLHRVRLRLAGQSGTMPYFPFTGTSMIAGRERRITYTIRAGAAPTLKIHPEVHRDEHSAHIDCAPEDLKEILSNVDKKFRKANRRLDLATSQSVRTPIVDPKLTGKLNLAIYAFHRAVVKMALGTAHFTLGYPWAHSSHAEQLRQCLRESDPRNWPPLGGRISIDGAPVEVEEIWSLGPDRHVLALINPPNGPLLFQCLLFGDIYGVVKMAESPWAGNEIGDEMGVVFVIDCRSRALSRHTVLEFIGLKLDGAFDGSEHLG